MEINSTTCGLSRLVSFSAILVLTLSAITSAQEKPVDKVNIGSYRIKKRPLLIFAPSDKEKDFAEQVENLKPFAEGLLERDVIVLVILEEGISRVENKEMTPKAAEALRKKMKIKPGEFKVIFADGPELHPYVQQDGAFIPTPTTPDTIAELAEKMMRGAA